MRWSAYVLNERDWLSVATLLGGCSGLRCLLDRPDASGSLRCHSGDASLRRSVGRSLEQQPLAGGYWPVDADWCYDQLRNLKLQRRPGARRRRLDCPWPGGGPGSGRAASCGYEAGAPGRDGSGCWALQHDSLLRHSAWHNSGRRPLAGRP